MRLRQIALVAEDLRAVEAPICQSLGVEVCYRDPGLELFGLRHGLYPIGDHLLEIVSPAKEGTTAGRYLERRGGDGGYMVIVQADDLEAERARLDATGIRIAFEAKAKEIQGLHLHPKDVGGAILSIVQAWPPESWAWAGKDWTYHRREDVVSDLVGVSIQAEDPAAMAASWSRALGLPIEPDAGDPVISLADAAIRFVPATDGRGDGLASAALVATDRERAGETVEVCGFRFELV